MRLRTRSHIRKGSRCRLDVTMDQSSSSQPRQKQVEDHTPEVAYVLASIVLSVALVLACWTDFWTPSQEEPANPSAETPEASLSLLGVLRFVGGFAGVVSGFYWCMLSGGLVVSAISDLCRSSWRGLPDWDRNRYALVVWGMMPVGVLVVKWMSWAHTQLVSTLPVDQRIDLWAALTVPICGCMLWWRGSRAVLQLRNGGWSAWRRWMRIASGRALTAMGIVVGGTAVLGFGFGLPSYLQNPLLMAAVLCGLTVKCWLGWCGLWLDIGVGVACLLRWMCVGDARWPGYACAVDGIADLAEMATHERGVWDTLLLMLSCALSLHAVSGQASAPGEQVLGMAESVQEP